MAFCGLSDWLDDYRGWCTLDFQCAAHLQTQPYLVYRSHRNNVDLSPPTGWHRKRHSQVYYHLLLVKKDIADYGFNSSIRDACCPEGRSGVGKSRGATQKRSPSGREVSTQARSKCSCKDEVLTDSQNQDPEEPLQSFPGLIRGIHIRQTPEAIRCPPPVWLERCTKWHNRSCRRIQ